MSFVESLNETLKTFFHPFYTYTFDNSIENSFGNSFNDFTLSNPQQIYLKRPILGENMFKLYKEDIKLSILPDSSKQLQVIHPWTSGRDGHVLFQYHDAPDSQDTKSIFTTIVFLGGNSLNKASCYRNKYPASTMSIMKMDKYGILN